ncbi:MAG: serine/threonine protein kinase, partial [Paludibacteraceae bacterium]|nr:serine/threonine protein kinase [Paludibacteraceae bacterium]
MIGKEILNYRIVSFIGKGGMGRVYLAEHKFISNQKVAIKMIHSNMANDYTRSRLKEEAEHLAELKHQNIVTFHDYHIDEEGNIYLIMEYADGKSLDDYIRTESGLIVQERVCPIFEPILDAVGYAHKHNILHRDIKPSNVVITKDGTPKILDFGIARLIKNKGYEANEDFIVGTPSYMSPEQVKGEKLDERSDIYSLGVMLHQMLTGNPPYDLTTLTELQINQKVVDEPLPRLRSYYRYVSDSVQKVVDKATAKNPANRYQNCADFKKALHNAIYPPKVSKGIWIGIAAAAVLFLGIGIFLWDYNRLKVSYYKDYVEQYGVPVGIGRVSEKTVHQRIATYRFESTQRKVRRVSLVNSKGHLCLHSDSEFKDRPARQEIFYSDNGNVDFVKIYDQGGKVLYRIDYNENLSVATMQYDDQYNTEFTIGNMDAYSKEASTAAGAEKSRISRYLLTYDENGYVIKKEYAGLYNKKVGDKNGIYAHVYKLDTKGRVIEDQYLGIDGEPKGLSNGLNIRTYVYDENDDWIETKYLTAERTASDNSQGLTVIKIEYDEYGNRISEKYYDLEGNMAYRSDELVAGIIYDVKEGQTRQYTFIGANEAPCPTNLGIFTQLIEYDDYGYISKVICMDENRKPFVTTEGFAIQHRVNGPSEELLEWWAYDENDSLMECSYGYAGFMGEYDSVGNATKKIYYDINRQPKILADGTSGFIDEYDDKNRVVKIINIDGNSTPIENEDGVAITRIQYDEKGNMIQVAYYDTTDSTLVLDKTSGIAGWNNIYDDNGNIIRCEYFGIDSRPALFNDCYAYYTMEYDENNFLVALYNYGVHGEKAVNANK